VNRVDTMETAGSVERGGLARTISVVGLSISQAADELQQAAERLIAAEEHAREADLRVAAAEEQVAQGAAQTAELLTLLQQAKDSQMEAEERARAGEERLRAAVERAAQLEEQVERLQAAADRGRVLEEQVRELEEQVRELEARVSDTEPQPSVTLIVNDERIALQEALAAEVRRPLTSILGITLALKHTDSKSPDGREMVRQLSTHARKLDRLVGEMLDVDRIVAGTFTPNLRRTDLEALVRRVVQESPDLANRDVNVETDHVAIQVDPALTEQMVETLLANAGRRTVPGNAVWVKVLSEGDGVVIAVEDTGTEVPTGLRQAMAEAAEGDGDGAAQRASVGPALSLLARLAEIHEGRCWVEERVGGGASFRVFLPDAASRAQDEEAPAEDEPREAAAVPQPFDERSMALARALADADDDEDLAI
jgi:K+-sensing histidine kinase KdpD